MLSSGETTKTGEGSILTGALRNRKFRRRDYRRCARISKAGISPTLFD